jgi:hypothetical protein
MIGPHEHIAPRLRMALGLGLGGALFIIERMLLDRLLALRREDDSSRFHGLCPPVFQMARNYCMPELNSTPSFGS